MSAVKIKSGSQVICVEGVHQGEKGKVTSVFRRYDEESVQMRKMVSFENERGRRITTRLSWCREI